MTDITPASLRKKLSKKELLEQLGTLEKERDQLRIELRHNLTANLYAEAMENISEAIVIYDKNGNLVDCNQNFRDFYGYSKEEAKPGVHYTELGKIDIELGNVAIGDEFGGGDDYLKRKAEYRRKLEGSFHVHLKDGRWIKTSDRLMFDGGFVSVQVDVSEIKLLEQKMSQMALYDPLTALPNRRLFLKNSTIALAIAKRNEGSLAVLFVDLDGFKLVNDKLGHNAGDKILKKIALRMQSRLRKSDTIARIGGDEFIILIAQHEGSNTALQVSDAIIKEIQKPFRIEGSAVTIGASIGIAYYPGDGKNINSLLSKADTAMYAAKGKGKNRWQEYRVAKT